MNFGIKNGTIRRPIGAATNNAFKTNVWRLYQVDALLPVPVGQQDDILRHDLPL
jgi:hypothetical protein